MSDTKRRPRGAMIGRTLDDLLAEIAAKHLGVETLAEQHLDSLDFHEVPVWDLRAALAAAYEAGHAAALATRPTR